MTVTQDAIWQVWDWCYTAYLRYGRKLAFPAHTDPTKTYQYRYLTAIVIKFQEWDFDDATCQHFIEIAARHAYRLHLMHKGLAALHQHNLLQISYADVLSEISRNTSVITTIQDMHAWLYTQTGSEDIISILLSKPHPDSVCKLALWHQSYKITDLYLALSKPCGIAMRRLGDTFERKLLPTLPQLYHTRSIFLKDHANYVAARQALGPDWREMCQ